CTPLAIFNRGANLFDDLRVYLSKPGEYLVLVDDANRLSGFDYVLQYLHEQRESCSVRLLVTVRDYALEKVADHTNKHGDSVVVPIDRLTDKQIEELVEKEFNIRNSEYQRRIAQIAKGNARLAVMAAQIAVRENTLGSIDDVSALYDHYFRSVREDI